MPRRVATLGKARASKQDAGRRIAALTAQLKRLESERRGEHDHARRRLAEARREFERRLTEMVQEIGLLRHHEARAAALETRLAAAEAALGNVPRENLTAATERTRRTRRARS
jgi:chromosome segregation ATPase